MKRKVIETLILCLVLGVTIFIVFRNKNKKETGVKDYNTIGNSIGHPEDPQNRANWELNRLKDPQTGTIPRGIRLKEYEFVKALPNDMNSKYKSLSWTSRGPFYIGGRTRALAIDINNENRILAGSVSGGLWQSLDAGSSWNKITKQPELHSITCIAQDKRKGKNNIWYYGTGELYGSSASNTGSLFLGNGIYKSIDNGLTWNSLTASASNTPHNWESLFDMVWNIALDSSRYNADVIFAAGVGIIYRSTDGGNSWKSVLGGGNNVSLFADVAVTSSGVVYATLGKESSTKAGGIYRSDDANLFYKITPPDFPAIYSRIVIAVNPVNENEVYFLGVSKGKGQLSQTFSNSTEWNSLWRYNYYGPDTKGAKGTWTDLSLNIPANRKTAFDNFNAQGSYNLLIKIKPNNPKTIFIGGTNLYRSDDGFTTPNKIFQIGGYEIGTKFPDFKVYKNHHPDQHNLLFLPSNPDIIISANDGGLSKSFNCMADTVRWEFLNNGYLSTQFYTIAIDENSKSDIIIGGLQDNGNYFVNSKDPQAIWTMPLNGDGAFCEFSKEPGIYYLSIQNGKVYKFNIENTGNIKGFRRIDPIGGKSYEFINSFVLDPNNSNIMYLAGGRYLYRNDSLNYINLDNKWDSISMGWYKFPDALKGPDTVISAVAVSKNPPNIVYYGTNQRNLFRIDNANNNFRYKRTNISDNKIFPYSGNSEGAKICCIAVDPDDGYKVIVVFSNYNVYSMFYSEDRGKTWMKVAGNLEANINGSGAGPSFRWVSIMPFSKERAYFLGTSTGLYVTDKLVNHTDSTSTIWTKFGSEYIGNIVVNMIKTRTTDNLVVVATHGNGVFSTNVTYDQIKGLCEHSRQNFGLLSLYPNPASEYVNIDIKLFDRAKADIEIYSRSGELISKYSKYLEKGDNKVSQVVNKFENGIYFVVVRYNNNCLSKAFVVLK